MKNRRVWDLPQHSKLSKIFNLIFKPKRKILLKIKSWSPTKSNWLLVLNTLACSDHFNLPICEHSSFLVTGYSNWYEPIKVDKHLLLISPETYFCSIISKIECSQIFTGEIFFSKFGQKYFFKRGALYHFKV